MRLSAGILLISSLTGIAKADEFADKRLRMTREQMEERGIRDSDVLGVIRATPRHLFLPRSLWDTAYEDRPLSIGHGATISQPYIVALMTSLLRPEKTNRVLEVGTGSGYQAAVLAQLTSRVYTIEIVPELARSARDTLKRLRYDNVVVRQGDGYAGWKEEAPFDRIILTAAPPEIPNTLVQQLATGGRLVAPVGPTPDQELVIIEKKTDGSLVWSNGGAVRFVPMVPDRR